MNIFIVYHKNYAIKAFTNEYEAENYADKKRKEEGISIETHFWLDLDYYSISQCELMNYINKENK